MKFQKPWKTKKHCILIVIIVDETTFWVCRRFPESPSVFCHALLDRDWYRYLEQSRPRPRTILVPMIWFRAHPQRSTGPRLCPRTRSGHNYCPGLIFKKNLTFIQFYYFFLLTNIHNIYQYI